MYRFWFTSHTGQILAVHFDFEGVDDHTAVPGDTPDEAYQNTIKRAPHYWRGTTGREGIWYIQNLNHPWGTLTPFKIIDVEPSPPTKLVLK